MSRAWLAGALALSLVASAAAQEPDEEEAAAPPAPPPPAETSDVAALNPLATLDKSGLTGFRDLPLFTPSRRRPEPPTPEVEAPPEPPAPARVEAPPEPPQLKLSGVVEGPDGAVAIVQHAGETERLRLGDQVAGWLVTSIEGFTLKLTLDDREEEYSLFRRGEGAAADASAASGEAEDDGTEIRAAPIPPSRRKVKRPPPSGNSQ